MMTFRSRFILTSLIGATALGGLAGCKTSGELVVARVAGTQLDAGRRAVVDEAGFMTSRGSDLVTRRRDAWTPANILAFTQAALTALRAASPS